MASIRRAASTVLACALLAGPGCGGGDSRDRVSGLTPDEILRRSGEAARGLTAYRAAIDGSVQADVTPGALPTLATRVLASPVSLSGEGPVNGADGTIDFDATLSGLPRLQGNVTKVGGELFVGLLGADYKVALPEREVAGVLPSRLASGLLGWAASPRDAGREAIDGADTVRISATVHVGRALGDLARAIGALSGDPVPAATLRRSVAQLRAALSERAVDVWVGVDDLIPRRVTVRLRFAGRVAALPQLRSASLDLDVRLSALGEAVEITPPSTTQVLDLARLGALAG